jgi:CHAT domain-containing protein/tetratricopeptide (TPR) repeat protein
VAASILLGLGLACHPESATDPYRQAVKRLEEAPSRPLRGRLTGAPHRQYRRPPGPTRGGAPELSRRRAGDSSPSWLSLDEREARALDWLGTGRLTEAVAELERIAVEKPGDPRAHNNLAAVRLEQAAREGDPAHALVALGAADRSLRLALSDEARWNRALALSAIPLPRLAREAWQEVAEREAAPEWAEEARAFSASVPSVPVLKRADNVPAEPRSPRGRAELEAAIDLRRSEHTPEAEAAYTRARSLLEAVRSPLALRARLGAAQTAGRVSWPELEVLGQRVKNRGDDLEAAVWRLMGMRSGREGRTEAALEFYGRAEEIFATLDHEEAAVSAALRAELLAEAEHVPQAWEALSRAFRRSDRVADPLHRHALFVIASSALRHLDPWAGVEVRREAAEGCVDLPERPLCPADSATALADRLQLVEAAPEEVERYLTRSALLIHGRAGAEDGRRRSEADHAAQEARWLASERNPRRDLEVALERSAAARTYYRDHRLIPPFLRAADEAAAWLGELGRTTEMEQLLEESRNLVRTETEPTRAVGLAVPARSIYERLIELRLAGGADEAALALVEELRCLGSGGARPVSLPPGTAAAVYWSSGGRNVAWLVTEHDTERLDLAGTDLSNFGERLAELSRMQREDLWREFSGELYDLWLAPVVERLPSNVERLVVVPDRALADLPFRALWNRHRGQYLEDRLAVELAPRLTELRPVEAPAAPPRSILAFGVPRFASALGLGDLAEVTSEASAVTRSYPQRVGCEGLRWTDFQACAARADVIHLATHARSREGDGGRSWIAFADQTVSLERLAAELPRLPLTRLVVLSACQSSFSAGGALGGLAPPFLAAGAETVVGSLWPVEDTELLRRFMTAFHESYRRSGEVAPALRQARAANPAIAGRPWLWGAFTVVTRPPSGGF